jgi:hypothetical protein
MENISNTLIILKPEFILLKLTKVGIIFGNCN